MNLDRTFSFRGDRTYLHSTSILNDLIALRAAAERGFDFRFDHKTASQIRYQDHAPEVAADLVGTWTDADGVVFIVKRDEQMSQSLPYDEDGLATGFDLAANTIRVPEDVGTHTVPEAVVSAFKALLKAGAAGPSARVAFVRMRCARLPSLPLQIDYARKIGGFYQGDISDEKGSAGQIYFGEWR